MQKKSHAFDYNVILKYLFILLTFVLLNNIEKTVYPYSISAYSAFIAIKVNPFICSILLLFSFVVLGEYGLLASVSLTCVIFTSVYFLYKKYNLKSLFEFSIYTTFSLAGFLILGNTINEISLYKKASICVITLLMNIVSLISLNALYTKGLKIKLRKEEYLSLSLFIVLLGLGISNLITPLLYKGIAILLILLIGYFFESGMPSLTSAILGISLSIYYNNVNYVALFLSFGILVECFMNVSRRATGILLIAFEYGLQYFFNVYPSFQYYDVIATASACLFFIMIPTKPLKTLKENFEIYNEKQLVKQTINRNRIYLSNRLYEISGVFSEMSNAFSQFKTVEVSVEKAKKTCYKKINSSVCSNCENYHKCNRFDVEIESGIKKIIDIGFAKGKLSLIDFPGELSTHCVHPSDLIFGLNKFIAEYKTYQLQSGNVKNGRELIKNEADGMKELLKCLALESGELLKYHSNVEKELTAKLLDNGINASEVLIYGEKERIKIGLILIAKEFSLRKIIDIISKTVQREVSLFEKNNITEDKYYLSFKVASKYDAVFGISKTVKDGSKISGDTYSVSKLDNGRFLIAIADGMGSGENAENVSSITLSLIESFYKSGMKSEIILPTVNKLLSLYTDDIFTALDVSVIDLYSCTADFIKYGSPYGFIINDSGIKIVEGSSLPLGIINEIKPTVCNTELNDGDMILIVSDGVSDSFGSSGDFIDYLRKIPAKNPQTLTDNIMKNAINKNNGERKDDMTALAVRVFKK